MNKYLRWSIRLIGPTLLLIFLWRSDFTRLMASFGNASGPIEAFNLGILSQKGSLYVTRPTLVTYTAKREDLLATANDLFLQLQAD